MELLKTLEQHNYRLNLSERKSPFTPIDAVCLGKHTGPHMVHVINRLHNT